MRRLGMVVSGAVLTALRADPALAECFNCNYGLGIYVIASLAVAAVTFLVGLVWLISHRRVPLGVVVVFLLSAVPVLGIVVLDWLGRI